MEQVGVLRHALGIHLIQQRQVVQDPEGAALRCHHHLVLALVEGDVRDGHDGHVQLDGLPRVAAVERRVYAELGARHQQVAVAGILPDNPGEMIRGDARDDALPRLAVVGGLVQQRRKIIQLVLGGGEVRGGGVEGRGLDGVDARPLRQVLRGDVGPALAGVLGDVHQTVVGAHPDHAFANGRFGSGEERAVIFDAGVVFGDGAAGRALLRLVVAGQVLADGLPALAFVRGFEEHVAARVQHLGVVRREEDGEVPLEAVLHGFGAGAHGVVRPHGDVAHLAGAVFVACQQAVVGARVDHVGVARIGLNPAALAAPHRVPIAFGDPRAVGARLRLHGAVVLLGAIRVIGEVVIESDAVELGGGLVHDGRPGFAAVGGDGGAAVIGLDHAVGIIGRDP